MPDPADYPSLLFVLCLGLLWLSAWLGNSVLRSRKTLDEDSRADFGVLLTATLSLLGLIIGFSFLMAINRYDQRKACEEAEANAMGTEYSRAGLLPAVNQPTPLVALAVAGMNDVLNTQGYTQAAWWNRIPPAAWGPHGAHGDGLQRNGRIRRPQGRIPGWGPSGVTPHPIDIVLSHRGH
jgi:hypothetical protein